MEETQWKIDRALPSDAAALAEFASRTFVETYGADNRSEDMRQHLVSSFGRRRQAKELADPTVVTLVTRRDGALVAYAQVRESEAPPCVTHERPVELHRFYVDRTAHGKGLAHCLMTGARRAAEDLGGLNLWLSVWERNPRAIAFYRKVGFVDVGETSFDIGSDRQRDRVLLGRVDWTADR